MSKFLHSKQLQDVCALHMHLTSALIPHVDNEGSLLRSSVFRFFGERFICHLDSRQFTA